MLALATTMLSTTELFALGVSASASLDELVRRFDMGPGGSYSTRVHFPKFIVPGNYASGFTFDLMVKDLAIGIGIADHANVPLFLQRTAYEQYRAASNSGFKGSDNTRMVEAILRAVPGANSHSFDDTLFAAFDSAAAFSNTVIAAESICLARAAGIKPEKTVEILSAGSGDSHALSHSLPAYISGTRDENAHSLQASWEAMALLGARFAALTTPLPMLRHATSILASATLRYGSQEDSRCVLGLLADWTATSEIVRNKREKTK
jgi:3-hydroxyisobutyrate dehydrogenase-like beta-hydroxyacid dehydrogenase